jgi:MraZ protein
VARRFRGESVHKVDTKGRVSIPASFRRVLEEGDPDWEGGKAPSLVIIHGRNERPRLECFTIRAMDEIDAIVSTYPAFSEEREELEYFLNTQSTYAALDENGRIVLGAKLRETIGLGDEAVFAGMGESFNIWDPEAYAADLAKRAERRAASGGRDLFALLDRSRLAGGGGS